LKNQKTFQKDGWRRMLCKACARIIGESHLNEKNSREIRCKECGNIQIIAPPRKGTKNGKIGYFWYEPGDSCFTAIVYNN